MKHLLSWRRAAAEAIGPSLAPASAAPPEADSARSRAERALRAWLDESGGGWNIAGCRVLQPTHGAGASAEGVFEFALTTRMTLPAREPRRVVAKCMDPRIVAAAARRLACVHAAADALGGQLAVPAPLHVDGPRAVLLQAAARGRCLADHPGHELSALLQGVERCGAALRELHEMPPQLLAPAGETPARVSIAAHLAALVRPAPFTLAAQCPPLRRRVVQVTHDLLAAEAACGMVAAVPLHRRLHPRRVFLAPQRVELVDWAQSSAGDAAFDLAGFMMHVDGRWPAQAAVLHAGLLRGWLAAGRHGHGREDALGARLHLYRAFHALRRACKVYRIECAALPAGGDAPPTLGGPALHRIAVWLQDAEDHLQACHRDAASVSRQRP